MLLIIQTFVWLVFIIGIVIFIHELGHFVIAKLVGVRVEEFAFGYGKKIFSKEIGGTLYRINMIPMGGYVKLLGEEEESNKKESFSKRGLVSKVGIIVAGVIMNFLLAVVTFYIVLGASEQSIFLPRISEYDFLGSKTEIQNKPIVEKIIDQTPAAEVSFPTDVIIWKVGDVEVKEINDLVDYLASHKGQQVEIEVMSLEGKRSIISVTPEKTEQEGVLLGVEFYNVVASFYKLDYSNASVLGGLLHSINFTGYTLDIFKELVVISFREKSVKPVSEGVSGVVGVANRVFDLVKVGDVSEILNLLAGVNLSLAIINIIPIPGLDGGHLFFILIEKVRGRKLAEKYQEWATRIGFGFLIMLGVLITIKDMIQFSIISRLFTWIKSLF